MQAKHWLSEWDRQWRHGKTTPRTVYVRGDDHFTSSGCLQEPAFRLPQHQASILASCVAKLRCLLTVSKVPVEVVLRICRAHIPGTDSGAGTLQGCLFDKLAAVSDRVFLRT